MDILHIELIEQKGVLYDKQNTQDHYIGVQKAPQ